MRSPSMSRTAFCGGGSGRTLSTIGSSPANKRLEPSPPLFEEDVGLIAPQHSLGLSLGAPGRVGRRGSRAIR